MIEKSKSKDIRYCTFCGKTEHEVKKLIAGPNVFICDTCIVLCIDIISHYDKEFIEEVSNSLLGALDHHYGKQYEI